MSFPFFQGNEEAIHHIDNLVNWRKHDKYKKKRPEVLVPAGTLEKLKVAVNYGADAVFVGGQAYGLRSRAGNFTMDELREGIEYAHARGVDVHVASNMVTHEGNEQGAGEWFRELRDMGLDAVIVSDPALIEICQPMHLASIFTCLRKLLQPMWRPFISGKNMA